MKKNKFEGKGDCKVNEAPIESISNTKNVLSFKPRKETSHNTDTQTLSQILDSKLVKLELEILKLSYLINELKRLINEND
jgi:hypothetical protein